MKAKLVIGISFILVFIATFILYLFVVNVVTPRFVLSSTQTKTVEQAPEVKVNKDPPETYSNVINNQLNSFNMEGKEETEKIEASVKAPGETYSVVSTEEEPSESVNEEVEVIEEVNEESEAEGQEVSTEENPTPQLDQVQPTVSPAPIPVPEVDLPKLDNPISEQKETINRVFVGSYDDVDQAKQAYDKVLDSGVDVAPIVKQVDGKYSLQMGAFSDKQKAKDLADKLKQQDLSAKVKSE